MQHGGELINDTKEHRSVCWAKNNNRNECLYNKEKSYGSMNYIEDLSNAEVADNLVDKVDYILNLDDAEFNSKSKDSENYTAKPHGSVNKPN